MSTKTKPAAKLAELEAAAHKARQERDRVRRDAQSHGEKLRALDASSAISRAATRRNSTATASR